MKQRRINLLYREIASQPLKYIGDLPIGINASSVSLKRPYNRSIVDMIVNKIIQV